MNKYHEMKQRQEKEINSFPMFFAFTEKRFDEGMRKLGLDPGDTSKIYATGSGGYYRKDDAQKLHDMVSRFKTELQEAMQDEDFAFQAFDYELANHEYNYTWDHASTLEALGLTEEEVLSSPMLTRVLKKAKMNQGECF